MIRQTSNRLWIASRLGVTDTKPITALFARNNSRGALGYLSSQPDLGPYIDPSQMICSRVYDYPECSIPDLAGIGVSTMWIQRSKANFWDGRRPIPAWEMVGIWRRGCLKFSWEEDVQHRRPSVCIWQVYVSGKTTGAPIPVYRGYVQGMRSKDRC